MRKFSTTIVRGRKAPYDTWTFVVIPDEIVGEWGKGGRWPVRGTLSGTSFEGTVSRGEGVYRMPIQRVLLQQAGVLVGDRVAVTLEIDSEPRPVDVPAELQAVLDADEAVARAFAKLPPSHRRAWATHVAEAKRPETRLRRASRAPDGILGKRFP